jgi:thioredoxin-related protein
MEEQVSFQRRLYHALIWVVAVFPVLVLAADETFDVQGLDDNPRIRNIQHPDWFKVSFLDLRDDLDEAIVEGKKGVIVYFSHKDCGYCEAMIEINFGRETDIVQYTREHFDVIPIDIWGSREVTDLEGNPLSERDFAIREKTNFTPAVIFYDAKGEEALSLRGYYPPYKFRAALKYVVDGYYTKETFRDYLARADPPPKFEIEELNSEEFFANPPYALDRTHFPSQRPLVVFFERRNCHACDILHSEPLRDDAAIGMLHNFEAIQLDMWSDTPVLTTDGQRITAKQWADQLGLFYAPALVFFDENGKEIIRLDSVTRLYRLKGVLDYVLTKGYLKAPTFMRWRELESQHQDEDKKKGPEG